LVGFFQSQFTNTVVVSDAVGTSGKRGVPLSSNAAGL
jgi:hypothetical protein